MGAWEAVVFTASTSSAYQADSRVLEKLWGHKISLSMCPLQSLTSPPSPSCSSRIHTQVLSLGGQAIVQPVVGLQACATKPTSELEL